MSGLKPMEVFISYARADQKAAQRLAEKLMLEGFDVWYDQDLNVGSEAFYEQIEKRIDQCDAVVVIWSAASRDSEWVWAEAEHARRLKKYVGIRIEDVSPRAPFGAFHTLDVFFGKDQYKTLSTELKTINPPPKVRSSRNFEDQKTVWLVGTPASGKSVVISHFLRYLASESDYVSNITSANIAGPRAKAFDLVQEWSSGWETNTFPGSTPRGGPIQIECEFASVRKWRRRNKLKFIESAGEHYTSFSKGKIVGWPDIDYFQPLLSGDGELLIVLCANMSHSHNWDEETDDVLSGALLFIESRVAQSKKVKSVVMANAPYSVNKEYHTTTRDQKVHYNPMSDRTSLKVFQSRYPKTSELMRRLKSPIIPFTIADEVAVNNEGDLCHSQPDFSAMQALANWTSRDTRKRGWWFAR